MEEHSVAIVMPAYNAVGLLPQTLPAALCAAGGGTVLVVDPGSTDRTAAVAEELGATIRAEASLTCTSSRCACWPRCWAPERG